MKILFQLADALHPNKHQFVSLPGGHNTAFLYDNYYDPLVAYLQRTIESYVPPTKNTDEKHEIIKGIRETFSDL